MIYLQISAPPPPPPLCKNLGGHLREPELTKKIFLKSWNHQNHFIGCFRLESNPITHRLNVSRPFYGEMVKKNTAHQGRTEMNRKSQHHSILSMMILPRWWWSACFHLRCCSSRPHCSDWALWNHWPGLYRRHPRPRLKKVKNKLNWLILCKQKKTLTGAQNGVTENRIGIVV